MTAVDPILNEIERAIDEIKTRNDVLAEALAAHASVIRMMAQQIKDISQHVDVDIDLPRMM